MLPTTVSKRTLRVHVLDTVNTNLKKSGYFSTRVLLSYLLFISCSIENPPKPIASCEFKVFWFKNQAQLFTHLCRFIENLSAKNFPGFFLQLMAITL